MQFEIIHTVRAASKFDPDAHKSTLNVKMFQEEILFPEKKIAPPRRLFFIEQYFPAKGKTRTRGMHKKYQPSRASFSNHIFSGFKPGFRGGWAAYHYATLSPTRSYRRVNESPPRFGFLIDFLQAQWAALGDGRGRGRRRQNRSGREKAKLRR